MFNLNSVPNIKDVLISKRGVPSWGVDDLLKSYPQIHDELVPSVQKWLDDGTVLDTTVDGLTIKQVMQKQGCNLLSAIRYLNVLLDDITPERREELKKALATVNVIE